MGGWSKCNKILIFRDSWYRIYDKFVYDYWNVSVSLKLLQNKKLNEWRQLNGGGYEERLSLLIYGDKVKMHRNQGKLWTKQFQDRTCGGTEPREVCEVKVCGWASYGLCTLHSAAVVGCHTMWANAASVLMDNISLFTNCMGADLPYRNRCVPERTVFLIPILQISKSGLGMIRNSGKATWLISSQGDYERDDKVVTEVPGFLS